MGLADSEPFSSSVSLFDLIISMGLADSEPFSSSVSLFARREGKAVEISKEQAKQLQAECEVTAIRRERPKSEKSYETRKENQCSYCGYKHIKGKCPAYGKKCSECQGKNHFAAVCKRKKKIKKNVNEIQQEEEDEEKSSEEEEVYIDNVEMKIVGSLNKARAAELMWSETINVEGQEVLFKLDTGAEVNVLTYETVHRLGLGKNIRKTNVTLVSYGNGVQVYFDDLIISGTTELEHDMNIRKVLDRAVKYNIKFNKSKVQFKSQKVKFMGQYFSSRGIEPSQTHIKAIVDMPKPQCKSDVLRLLGMAKFLGKHIPNMSKIKPNAY
ncbi:hypothetical protein QE152_g10937 [Popillia japonica]|uniref:Reverse transcriptase domain-containing protein n=1 Tax=Popillia japonica TaxID=7064 RepID=A0AAW1LRX3_POPJA